MHYQHCTDVFQQCQTPLAAGPKGTGKTTRLTHSSRAMFTQVGPSCADPRQCQAAKRPAAPASLSPPKRAKVSHTTTKKPTQPRRPKARTESSSSGSTTTSKTWQPSTSSDIDDNHDKDYHDTDQDWSESSVGPMCTPARRPPNTPRGTSFWWVFTVI